MVSRLSSVVVWVVAPVMCHTIFLVVVVDMLVSGVLPCVMCAFLLLFFFRDFFRTRVCCVFCLVGLVFLFL